MTYPLRKERVLEHKSNWPTERHRPRARADVSRELPKPCECAMFPATRECTCRKETFGAAFGPYGETLV